MLWYTGCVDNFFEEPNKILELSNKLNYKKSFNNKFPGERSENTFDTNRDFFIWTTKKILTLFYPMGLDNFEWSASQFFQKINGDIYKNDGWVHLDKEAELTAIIYLSKHKNCGTNIYSPKFFNCEPIHVLEKEKSYQKTNLKNDKYLIENNERYEKNISYNSKFNRLIFFDGSQCHAANKFAEENINEDRLTLITFFYNIIGRGIKYPISQMRRVL